MRYLKKFNESNSDDFYLEISIQERNILLEKIIMMNQKMFETLNSKILEVFRDYNPEIKIIDVAGTYLYLLLKNNDGMFIDIDIHILSDEWFLVDINLRYNKLYRNYNYYKCDQLDGLFRFFDDLVKNDFKIWMKNYKLN